MRSILSLNGTWQLVLDPDDIGLSKNWQTGECLPEGVSVQVPSVWDIWVPDYDGVGWYFKEFEFFSEKEGYVWDIQFDAADYYAEVWLNGKRLGEHEGGYTPFTLPATHALHIGKNLLAVRIVDPHAPQGYKHFIPKQIPCAKEHGYFTFAGLWGDVRLVGKNDAHIQDVFVQPDIHRKKINVLVDTSSPVDIRLEIAGTPQSMHGKPGKLTLPFPDCEFWSPENPTLYYLKCSALQNEEVVDHVEVRFGMREFTVKENRFYLNNRPVFVKGVLHQPDYPLSLASPISPEMARQEIEAAKKAGFNLIRLHIKTAPKITLDLCDEIGLMVYEEPPIGWIQTSPYMRERCEREVREMILRDRNHPSVVIWGILNESGNAGYVVNGGAQTIKDDLCHLARSLDPTRIIIDDSGGMNATREPSRLIRPYKNTLEQYEDLHIYQRAPVDTEIENYYKYNGDPNNLYFLSEFGFGGIEDLPEVIKLYKEHKNKAKDARFLKAKLESMMEGFRERELDRVFGSFSAFAAACQEVQCDAIRFQIDACRSNTKLAGYCYTQLCDAGHEVGAGVLDHWRRPKPAFSTMAQVQTPIRLLIQCEETNLAPRQETHVSVNLISDVALMGPCELSLQVVGPTGQVLWKKKRRVQNPKNGRVIWSGSVSASGAPGVHTLNVQLLKGRKNLASDSREFFVCQPPEPFGKPVTLIDPYKEWSESFRNLAPHEAHDAGILVVPPLSNTVRAYPAESMADLFAKVHDGAVAIFFEPPADWNELAEKVDAEIKATSKDAVGAFLGMYHYVKTHPVFEGLPNRCLMRQPYRNVIPARTFLEKSDEDICGTFDTNPMAPGHYMIQDAPWWGSDILVRRYGSGRLVFTHLRVFEYLKTDPVAARLLVNLLNHFSRRAVPSEGQVVPNASVLRWLKQEQQTNVRRWMVCGMFANWGESGHDTSYPPETEIDFSATYTGWYKPIGWRRWYSLAQEDHLVNLQQAFTPVFEYYPRFDRGVGYAYTEFSSPERTKIQAVLHLKIQDSTKVWLNNILEVKETCHLPHKQLKPLQKPITIRPGRNALLVKVSKVPGEFQFALDIKDEKGQPIEVIWWK
ncbi:MAG TPA: glycoside hydrolase family 2 TIM barrel-domain containing protein [Candidatus Hydrogenedentes bacterium]|nr:glycoside hydrolase family 2 TIM barrel-domain containing protein [Candidatus Hydrogenedentota bacterium]HOL75652.1 glycoside hydrolase family 2 TIM barrel-domain containing protein [Candidatus Hydrogenedentota bacterium]HPO84355.1 glycoside hydrolase family 2 TIM barrel-domain containing protein [Candidatus Hydrogenedentota bacterium]